MTRLWPILAAFLLIGVFLPPRRRRIRSRPVKSSLAKASTTPAEVRAKRAAQARHRRLEDKVDMDRARKTLSDIDSGISKPLTWEEFNREVDRWL